jgi:hypothetical protein
MVDPVIYPNRDKAWHLNGRFHRDDGPAIEYADGGVGWYLFDQELTLNAWLIANTSMTDEEKVMFKLKYG